MWKIQVALDTIQALAIVSSRLVSSPQSKLLTNMNECHDSFEKEMDRFSFEWICQSLRLEVISNQTALSSTFTWNLVLHFFYWLNDQTRLLTSINQWTIQSRLNIQSMTGSDSSDFDRQRVKEKKWNEFYSMEWEMRNDRSSNNRAPWWNIKKPKERKNVIF